MENDPSYLPSKSISPLLSESICLIIAFNSSSVASIPTILSNSPSSSDEMLQQKDEKIKETAF